MSILKELYNCDFLHVMEPDTEEWHKKWAEREALVKRLQEQFTEEQFKLIDDCLSLEADLAQIYQAEIFCEGIKMGAQLYREMTGPDRMRML